jgi:fused signal recognition particle receptor
MAFNWFRRQFQPEDAPESPAEQASPATSESPSGEGDSADAVQEDYLAWAKAAYQNIQQRQQPVAAAETETVELGGGEAEKADPEIPDPSPQDAAKPDVLEPDVPEPDVLESNATVLEDAETAESPIKMEAIASTPSSDSLTDETAAVSEGSSAEDSPAEPSSNLPLWARADAERQARLERLKATAIETVEVSVTPAPQSIAPSPVQPRQTPAPEISSSVSAPDAPPDASPGTLDEGFLWSAEVLAAQGRRPDEVSADEITWLQKLRKGLDKTRLGLVNQLKTIVGKGPLTQEAVMEIEALLLQADVGVGATDTIIEALQQRMLQETLPPDEAIAYLKKFCATF